MRVDRYEDTSDSESVRGRDLKKYLSPIDLSYGNIITDVSLVVNNDALIHSKSQIDGYALFDLDTFICILLLYDGINVVQPFDNRYPNRRFLEWIDNSEIFQLLHEKKLISILQEHEYVGDVWNTAHHQLQSKEVRKALTHFQDWQRAMDITIGFGQKLGVYDFFYRSLYSPQTMEYDDHNDSYAILLYRTNLCLRQANLYKIPYHPHSVKALLIDSLFTIPNGYFYKEILSVLSKQIKGNIIPTQKNFVINHPSFMNLVLGSCNSKDDILDRIMEMRQEETFQKLRNLTRKFDEFVMNDDQQQVNSIVNALRRHVRQMQEEFDDELVEMIIANTHFKPPPELERARNRIDSENSPEKSFTITNPMTLKVIKDLVERFNRTRDIRTLIKRVFHHELKPPDLTLFAYLQSPPRSSQRVDESEYIKMLIEKMLRAIMKNPKTFAGLMEEKMRHHLYINLRTALPKEIHVTQEDILEPGRPDLTIETQHNIFPIELKRHKNNSNPSVNINQLRGYMGEVNRIGFLIIFVEQKEVPKVMQLYNSFLKSKLKEGAISRIEKVSKISFFVEYSWSRLENNAVRPSNVIYILFCNLKIRKKLKK